MKLPSYIICRYMYIFVEYITSMKLPFYIISRYMYIFVEYIT